MNSKGRPVEQVCDGQCGGGFMTGLRSAAAWPVVARSVGKVAIIGFLATGTSSVWSHWVDALVQRLRELGWIEGSTIAIEIRWAEGRTERYAEIAAELSLRDCSIVLLPAANLPHRPPLTIIPCMLVRKRPSGVDLCESFGGRP
jgi:hypothetical protein